MCKNLSATVNWQIWAAVLAQEHVQTGRSRYIAAGDNDIQVVELGEFAMPWSISEIKIHAQNDATGSDTSDNLDIDYILGVIVDDSTRLVRIGPLNIDGSIASSEFYIKHKLDSELRPEISSGAIGGGNVLDYPASQGDTALASTGNTISCLVFGNDIAGANWVILDDSTELNQLLIAKRTLAYLTPV
jgi:hypothetical protein